MTLQIHLVNMGPDPQITPTQKSCTLLGDSYRVMDPVNKTRSRVDNETDLMCGPAQRVALPFVFFFVNLIVQHPAHWVCWPCTGSVYILHFWNYVVINSRDVVLCCGYRAPYTSSLSGINYLDQSRCLLSSCRCLRRLVIWSLLSLHVRCVKKLLLNVPTVFSTDWPRISRINLTHLKLCWCPVQQLHAWFTQQPPTSWFDISF